MTRTELIDALAQKQTQLNYKDVDAAVRVILEYMAEVLEQGGRIEIRGFGSFSLHYHPPRKGRNPKTGEAVTISAKHKPHFKPGIELRERVNAVFSDEWK